MDGQIERDERERRETREVRRMTKDERRETNDERRETRETKELCSNLLTHWQLLLAIFYLFLWLTPFKFLFRRPSAILYARFWGIFRIFAIIAPMLAYFPQTKLFGNCFFAFGIIGVFSVIEPYILYRTLLRDSRWWQGIRIRQGKLKRTDTAIRFVSFFHLTSI